MGKIYAGIDPSSKDSGYAFLEDTRASLPKELNIGLIKPVRAKTAIERIQSHCDSVRELLTHMMPSVIVIEIASGKVNKGRHKGGGAGLSVYGMAVGAIWHVCMLWAVENKAELLTPNENEWTAHLRPGEKAKEKRAAKTHLLYPSEWWINDKGHDAADAVQLAMWGIDERNRDALIADD